MFAWFTSPSVVSALDGINKIAQVLALAVAGYWGYHLYERTSKPGLEFRGGAEADVTWSEAASSDSCLGSFSATIKNDGLRSFDLTNYTVHAWLFSQSELVKKVESEGKSTAGAPVFVNYDEIKNISSFYDEETDKVGLVGHYAPGEQNHLSWDFIFKKNKDQGVLFSIEGNTKGETTDFVKAWKADNLCPEQKIQVRLTDQVGSK